VALDPSGNRWIYFGTGRFFTRDDASDADPQSYYGIKEHNPGLDNTDNDLDGQIDEPDESAWTWAEVSRTDPTPGLGLRNVSGYWVFEGSGRLTDLSGNPTADPSTWEGLKIEIKDEYQGWYRDLALSLERNLGQAVLLGDLLTYTTYEPSSDICTFGGESYLHAYHYLTGTPYIKPGIGYESDTVDFGGGEGVQKRIKGTAALGSGLSLTPNVHVGRQSGSKAFIQTSSGAIKTVEQLNPGYTKSGVSSWRERE
jgi:type IV pilus assembly protein PilY1